ncbi:MAG: nicotinate-nucleotide adenylyltransferase [Dehalococcoidales bacterium]
MAKMGVMGGTFDPIHNGHLAVAREVISSLALDGVLFVPAGLPPLKDGGAVASGEDRVNMVRLAIAEEPRYQLSRVEVDRPGPSYTVDTISGFKANNRDELYFVMGWDNLAELYHWKDPGRLAEICWIVAVPRPGCNRPDLDSIEALVPCVKSSLILLESPLVDISASDIRERVAGGLTIGHLVPAKVADYIKTSGLYASI